MKDLNILIGSPVLQKPAILKEFIESLSNISRCGLNIDFIFIDDNISQESKNILRSFAPAGSMVYIVENKSENDYICTEETHNWNNTLVWKVADFKNFIISYSIEKNYDYLFLIDSDVILHPYTLMHLLNQGKDIISEIFWTRWTPESMQLPQVWLYDRYVLYEPGMDVNLTKEEVYNKVSEFIKKLRTPGVYKVGGLGACTLISRKAIESGVSFKRIPNISFQGEDRHFCIRAAVLGFDLYVDTHYPAYHIYRESELVEANEFKRKCGYLSGINQ